MSDTLPDSSTTSNSDVKVSAVSRREFLYYLWGASLGLLLVESCGLMMWYPLPSVKYGEASGVFRFAANKIPPPLSLPVGFPVGKL